MVQEYTAQEFKVQGSKFEGWFSQACAKAKRAQEQVDTLNQAVHQQSNEIGSLRQAVVDQHLQIQASVQSAVGELQRGLSGQLQSQLEQIEPLPAKRGRSE